ncbi:hypothetical protein H7X65_01800 [Candidatus Parcubacteria bacterium]|nr:hypothetical protein [Candidatus Parcubacteria bacterium]
MFSVLLISLLVIAPQTSLAATSVAKKNEMIRKSIQGYKGSCPCPYNTMKNGRSCGKNSAWSKPGGASPLCYVSDIK